MSTLEMFRSAEDSRRHWRRVPVRFELHCTRIGRSEQEMVVEAMNMSPGGVRLRAPQRLMTGDVVLFWVEPGVADSPVALKGLVVQATAHRNGACDVHVAWTNLSPASSDELARLLTIHDTERRADGADAG